MTPRKLDHDQWWICSHCLMANHKNNTYCTFSDCMRAKAPRPAHSVSQSELEALIADPPRQCAAMVPTFQVLGEIGLQSLRHALKHTQEGSRYFAAFALCDLEDAGAVTDMIGALRDPSPRVRWWAGNFFNHVVDPLATGPLIDALQCEQDGNVTSRLVEALGRYTDRRTIRPLLRRYFERFWDSSGDHTEALVENAFGNLTRSLGSKFIVQELLNALADPELQVMACAALGDVGDETALPTLRTLGSFWTSRGRSLKRVARIAIGKIQHRCLGLGAVQQRHASDGATRRR